MVGAILFVDDLHGSYGSDGLAPEDAVSSLGRALELAQPGDTILLRASGRYLLDASNSVSGLAIGSYGDGDAPLIDLRQPLTTANWQQISETVWTATISFRDAPTSNLGANSAHTTHHQIWAGDELLHWQFAGASIEENIAAVAELPDSFTIHYKDSPVPDPRNDVAGSAEFVVYVHVPFGQTPQAADLSIADQQTFNVSGLVSLSGVSIVGPYGKDTVGTQQAFGDLAEYPVLQDVSIVDAPAHAIVGPFLSTGTLTVSGRGDAGHPYHEYGWNSEGGLVNIYTSHRFGEEISFETIIASNGYKAVYGHGSSSNVSYGYSRLSIGTLRAEAVDVAIDMTGVYNGAPFVDEIFVGYLNAVGISRAVMTSGDVEIASGDLTFSEEVGVRPFQSIFEAQGENQVFILRDTEVRFERLLNPYSQYHAFVRGSQESVQSSLLILDGVNDTSQFGSQAYIPRNFTYGPQMVLIGGSSIGNLQALNNLTDKAQPAALIVEAGSTFGLGNRTGPEIEAFLASKNIRFSISSDTTIVARDGTVLSEPGWSHFEGLPDGISDAGSDTNEAIGGSPGNDVLSGAGGHDVVAGGEGDDSLFGGTGNDIVIGGPGDDALSGGDGDDTLMGGDGDDTLMGGAGSDRLDGGAGTDWVSYAESDVAFYYSIKSHQVYGAAVGDQWIDIENYRLTDHDDTLILDNRTGSNVVRAGDGNDRLWGGGGTDSLFGEAGDDRLTAMGNGTVELDGGAGNDDLHAGVHSADVIILAPGCGHDRLHNFNIGTAADQIDLRAFGFLTGFSDVMALATQQGDSVLFDFGNSDTLLVVGYKIDDFEPSDFLFAGPSGDQSIDPQDYGYAPGTAIAGTTGDDLLQGTSSGDILIGGPGDDDLSGRDGDDTLIGGEGSDILDGGPGTDWASYAHSEIGFYYNVMSGQAYGAAAGDQWIDIENYRLTDHDDTLILDNRSGSNEVRAGAGNDRLWSGGGSDSLFGEAGNDRLTAMGNGRVALDGGVGDDALHAGMHSADVIVFAPGSGNDTVHEFSAGTAADLIDVSAFGFADGFRNVMALASQQGNGVLFEFGSSDTLYVTGLQIGDFAATDFVF